MKLFGTSGIRDLAPSKMSASMALRIGRLLARKCKTLVAGYDGRETGHLLKAALAAGAGGAGARVLDIGLCATPTLAGYCRKIGAFGAMVTASHNPPAYNGIKLFEKGREMPKELEESLERELLKEPAAGGGRWPEFRAAGPVAGAQGGAQEAHLSLLLSKIDGPLIRKKRPKVVVDCANLAACALMPRALRAAGAQVVVLNGTVGAPYGRALEPNESSLQALGREVVRQQADIGIAHDGDADRAIIVDEKGAMAGLDAQLAMAVRRALEDKKGQKAKKRMVVSTVESSLSLRTLCEKEGAALEITPVGSLHVAQRMRETGAVFGGEPCGEYIFSDGVPSPDGLMAGLFFLEMACAQGPLSALALAQERYPVGREKIPCANEGKKKAMGRILKDWPFGRPNRMDGLRSDEKEGWVLIRPSGTEPYIRITIEARSEKKLQEMMQKAHALVKEACRGR